MKKFGINPIQHDDMLKWLWHNVGPGFYWSYKWTTREIEPADGDAWGYCGSRGRNELFILDDEKAAQYYGQNARRRMIDLDENRFIREWNEVFYDD